MSSSVSQHALVVAPHPDDETFGCGGTIKVITSQGGRVDVVFLTAGEMGLEPGAKAPLEVRQNLAETRTREARLACETLGVDRITFLDGEDSRLHLHAELAGQLAQILNLADYRSVFSPWPREAHGDHAAAFKLLVSALSVCTKDLDVWLYEVWTPLEPNLLIPIDATLAAKMEAIECYQSQLAVMDYGTAFRALAQYRSLLCPPAKHAEAFFTCDRLSLLEGRDLPWLERRPPADRQEPW